MKPWLGCLCGVMFSGMVFAEECAAPYFGIRVVEESTGAGVPLV